MSGLTVFSYENVPVGYFQQIGAPIESLYIDPAPFCPWGWDVNGSCAPAQPACWNLFPCQMDTDCPVCPATGEKRVCYRKYVGDSTGRCIYPPRLGYEVERSSLQSHPDRQR